MDFNIINKLKQEVDCFDDADFVSAIDENTVAARRLTDDAVFAVPFVIEENGLTIFKGSEAKIIQEGKSEDSDAEQETLASVAKQYLLSEDNDVSDLCALIISSDVAPRKQEQKSIVENSNIIELSEEEQLVINEFYSKWDKKVKRVDELEKEFMSNGRLFAEDGNPRQVDVVGPYTVAQAYVAKNKQRERILAYAQPFAEFMNIVSDNIGVDASIVMEGIDMHGEDSDFSVRLSRNLAVAKQKGIITENIAETIKKVRGLRKQWLDYIENCGIAPWPADGGPGSAEDTDRGVIGPDRSGYHFLKYNIGEFSRNDLKLLMDDFNKVIARFNEMDQESLQEIAGMRSSIDWMWRTNQVDDELVAGIIKDFNSKFGAERAQRGIQGSQMPKHVTL